MLVDWVEYYPWNGAGFDPSPAWRDDFDTFDSNRWGKADWTFGGNRADFIPQNAYVQNGSLVLALTRETQNTSSSSSSSSSSSGGSGSGGGGCIGQCVKATKRKSYSLFAAGMPFAPGTGRSDTPLEST